MGVILLSVDQDTAERYPSVYWSLRRKGHPIPTDDMWIAATALQHGLALYSYDSHFQAVDGVSVEKQLADFTD
jgi:tRNA(fMet)-specific endonuclease VapC